MRIIDSKPSVNRGYTSAPTQKKKNTKRKKRGKKTLYSFDNDIVVSEVCGGV